MKKRSSSSTRRRSLRLSMVLRWSLGMALVGALAWFGWLYFQINAVACEG